MRLRFRQELKQFATEVAQIKTEFPDLTDEEALTVHILRLSHAHSTPAARGKHLATLGMPWPFHTKAEPNKNIRLTTDRDQFGWDGLAKLMTKATIHPVDAYFNQARRRIAGFERGIPSAANSQRIWHAYSYYNPEMVPKLVTILRFYHNYMLRMGNKNETPAMALSLAKGVVYERDLFSS